MKSKDRKLKPHGSAMTQAISARTKKSFGKPSLGRPRKDDSWIGAHNLVSKTAPLFNGLAGP